MDHPDLLNESGLAYDALHLCDEAGVPVYVPLLQATCVILDDGRLGLLKEQPPVNVAGAWHGDPATSSLRLEPQIAFVKPGTDVVLLGHAHPARDRRNEGKVGIRVGPVQKVARVFGDRWLITRSRSATITAPEPFERIPIVYERCFGGWDRRFDTPDGHRCDARNPVGIGFRDVSLPPEAETLLPNFEDPDVPYRAYGDMPPPAGFGFVQPAWQPRAVHAGTYDKAWEASRKPLLPTDFNRRFFNAASPGLTAEGYLAGDEPVVVVGATPDGRVAFDLPGIVPPPCLVGLRVGKPVALQPALDTVVVDLDARRLTLLWRAHLRLRNGAHDVVAVEVVPEAERVLDGDD